MDLSAHRLEIAKSLTALEASIARLIDALSHGSVSAQVENATTDSSATRRICDAYSTIDYEMDDDVNSSPVCLGVVGVNADTLKRAQAVNTAKAKFKTLCTPLQGIRIRIPVKGERTPTKAIPAIRVLLRNIQRSDLNLLAAYRRIPILERPPATVTYTRANTRAVYRKSVEEIAAMLENLNSQAASADREKLRNLDRRITHLALVKERYRKHPAPTFSIPAITTPAAAAIRSARSFRAVIYALKAATPNRRKLQLPPYPVAGARRTASLGDRDKLNSTRSPSSNRFPCTAIYALNELGNGTFILDLIWYRQSPTASQATPSRTAPCYALRRPVAIGARIPPTARHPPLPTRACRRQAPLGAPAPTNAGVCPR